MEEKKPGLLASRKIDNTSGRSSVAGRIAKDAAQTALTVATQTGDVASDLAQGAGRTLIDAAAQPGPGGTEGLVLLLDAPVEMDVFVTHAM